MSKKSRARAAAKGVGSAPLPKTPTVSSGRRDIFFAGSLVVLAALAAYHNSFSVPFIWDDSWSITTNPTLHRLGSALSPPPDKGVGGRPLLNLTFALNYALGGFKVWGYHAVNLLIHALAGLVLFGIVRRTLLERRTSNVEHPTSKSNHTPHQSRGAIAQGISPAKALSLALAVAVIWVVHPIQTEAVTYISQRAESLMGLFYLLTLYCFIRGVENCRSGFTPDASGINPDLQSGRGKPSHDQNGTELRPLSSALWLLASICCCLLGGLSKEIIATAPVIVLFYDRTFVAGSFWDAWRLRWRYYLGLASTWLLLAHLMAGLGQRGVGFDQKVTWWNYALTSCRSVVLYCKSAIWPHPLIFDYGINIVQHATEIAPYALVLAALLAAVVVALRYRPVIGFAGAWFFVILAPTSSVVPIADQPMAEHRLYLSLAAVVAVGVVGLYRLIGRRSLMVCAAAAMGLGWLSVQRNQAYRSDLAIWGDTAAKCPDNARAHNNLGIALEDAKRIPEAIAEYNESLRLNPDSAEEHSNLGNALLKVPGRLPDAIAQYEASLRVSPDYAAAHNNLGTALRKMPGRLPDAIAEYQTALRIEPGFIDAHDNLGEALQAMPGRLPDAIAEYKTALRIEPYSAKVHYDLGTALLKMPGRSADAMAEFEAALRIDPDSEEAHNNLGNALLNIPGRLPDAMAEFQAVLRINPDNVKAHNNLGGALSQIPGRLPDAIAQFEAALRIKPDDVNARANLDLVRKMMAQQTAGSK